MLIRLYFFSGLRLLALAWVVNVSLGVATFAWAVPAAESPATIRAAVEAFVRAGCPRAGKR